MRADGGIDNSAFGKVVFAAPEAARRLDQNRRMHPAPAVTAVTAVSAVPIAPAGDLQAIVDFVLEIDKLKAVLHKTRPLGQDRYENSAEHSWQIALLAASLVRYSPQAIDTDRVVAMLLVHDIGEIDTGDTLVYAEGDWTQRKADELAAVRRIFGLLPAAEHDRLLALWLEFEAAETPEARFANAADRAMPALLNLANQGQSWRENGISHQRVVDRIGPPIRDGCPALWDYMERQLQQAADAGWFGSALPARR